MVLKNQEGSYFFTMLESKLGELAWRKSPSRYPQIWKNGSLHTRLNASDPPVVAFRFKNENNNLIKELRNIIENYQGKVKWKMYGHRRRGRLKGINWAVLPLSLYENKQQKVNYMDAQSSAFNEMAFDDLINLTNFIYKTLDK